MTLEQWWKQAKKRGVVYYTTDHITRTGMGASYSLYVVAKDGRLERAWPDSGKGYDEKLAKALGFRMGKRRNWYRSGCGYDRVHDILYTFARHFGDDLKVINAISREGLGE